MYIDVPIAALYWPVNSSAEILTPDLSTRTGSQAQDQPSGARLPTPKWSHNLAVSNVYQGS